jgi:hypothetical protein
VPGPQRYDLHSKAYFTDPYPVCRAMRAHDPVHRESDTGAWLNYAQRGVRSLPVALVS